MLTLINLTPHPLVLRLPDGTDQTFAPTAPPARVTSKVTPSWQRTDLPVPLLASPEWGPVEGLPTPTPGIGYLVSGLVLAQCSGRADVFAPATGPQDGAIRNEKGHIIAVTKLLAAPGL